MLHGFKVFFFASEIISLKSFSKFEFESPLFIVFHIYFINISLI